uniref:SAM domain-containing protein n=1 Tax=Plectus sambesii TaxID=2011161 RepID=A0A914VF15_9BILA
MTKKLKKSIKDGITLDLLGKIQPEFNETAELPKGVTLTRLEPVNNVSETPVEEWSCVQVADWLMTNGFAKYADLIAHEHGVDGATLLMINETDFRQKPLEIKSLGDVKRLSKAIAQLRKRNRLSSIGSLTSSIVDDVDFSPGLPCLYQNGTVVKNRPLSQSKSGPDLTASVTLAETINGVNISQMKFLTREEWIARVESQDTKEKALMKLFVAFFYCLFSLLATAFVMVLVHERVPDMKTYPPLPDIFLDNIPLIPWAFEVCEMIAVCMSFICFTNLFFHKHRVIIMRRMFSLVGTVFLLRCVTMLITSLSVPGIHLECSAKMAGRSLWEQLKQAFHIWSRLGMSIHGVRSCGDYMFSGHTTAMTLLNHFITEYTPDSWHFVHTTTWVMNLFGIFFILAGHEHYSIDVFIAFYISSRMFLYYHSYAYNHPIVTATDARTRMWFPLGWFFEAGGHGRVENEYEFPLSMPDLSFVKRLLSNGGGVNEQDSKQNSPEHNKSPQSNGHTVHHKHHQSNSVKQKIK